MGSLLLVKKAGWPPWPASTVVSETLAPVGPETGEVENNGMGSKSMVHPVDVPRKYTYYPPWMVRPN